MHIKHVAIAGFLAMTGCATTRAIQVNDASVEGPVRAAEELQTQKKSPQAELHVQYARDQLAAARKLDGDHEDYRASLMRLRAQSDAELAVALAKLDTAQGELDAMQSQSAPATSTQSTTTTTTSESEAAR